MKNFFLLSLALVVFALPSTSTPASALAELNAELSALSTPPAGVIEVPSEVPGGPGTPFCDHEALRSSFLAAVYGVDPNTLPHVTTWTAADGFSHKVSTPKKIGEGANNWAKRHYNNVKSLAKEVGGPAATVQGT